MTQVNGWFKTREAADLAIEHLVQVHKIARSDIFVQPAGDDNTIGIRVSGGDEASTRPGTTRRLDGALGDTVELSVDVEDSEVGLVKAELQRAGAVRLEVA